MRGFKKKQPQQHSAPISGCSQRRQSLQVFSSNQSRIQYIDETASMLSSNDAVDYEHLGARPKIRNFAGGHRNNDIEVGTPEAQPRVKSYGHHIYEQDATILVGGPEGEEISGYQSVESTSQGILITFPDQVSLEIIQDSHGSYQKNLIWELPRDIFYFGNISALGLRSQGSLSEDVERQGFDDSFYQSAFRHHKTKNRFVIKGIASYDPATLTFYDKNHKRRTLAQEIIDPKKWSKQSLLRNIIKLKQLLLAPNSMTPQLSEVFKKHDNFRDQAHTAIHWGLGISGGLLSNMASDDLLSRPSAAIKNLAMPGKGGNLFGTASDSGADQRARNMTAAMSIYYALFGLTRQTIISKGNTKWLEYLEYIDAIIAGCLLFSLTVLLRLGSWGSAGINFGFYLGSGILSGFLVRLYEKLAQKLFGRSLTPQEYSILDKSVMFILYKTFRNATMAYAVYASEYNQQKTEDPESMDAAMTPNDLFQGQMIQHGVHLLIYILFPMLVQSAYANAASSSITKQMNNLMSNNDLLAMSNDDMIEMQRFIADNDENNQSSNNDQALRSFSTSFASEQNEMVEQVSLFASNSVNDFELEAQLAQSFEQVIGELGVNPWRHDGDVLQAIIDKFDSKFD